MRPVLMRIAARLTNCPDKLTMIQHPTPVAAQDAAAAAVAAAGVVVAVVVAAFVQRITVAAGTSVLSMTPCGSRQNRRAAAKQQPACWLLPMCPRWSSRIQTRKVAVAVAVAVVLAAAQGAPSHQRVSTLPVSQPLGQTSHRRYAFPCSLNAQLAC